MHFLNLVQPALVYIECYLITIKILSSLVDPVTFYGEKRKKSRFCSGLEGVNKAENYFLNSTKMFSGNILSQVLKFLILYNHLFVNNLA